MRLYGIRWNDGKKFDNFWIPNSEYVKIQNLTKLGLYGYQNVRNCMKNTVNDVKISENCCSNPQKTLNSRFLSTVAPEAAASPAADAAAAENAEVVEDSGKPTKTQRLTQPYSSKAITTLKLDQYPFIPPFPPSSPFPMTNAYMSLLLRYVEREWWKTGKRMTFWASWRQLRDVKRRQQVQEVGADRMRLKAIKFNTILPQAIRDEAAEKMQKARRYDHPRLILNMCQFTGRQRGKIKPYRLSRHLFRRFADRSALSGVQRAMW
ncbi:Protein CBR-MRPS-14 [Caenorhabditis briggsae]|uniref:Protein CBR-MRPS-14 n=1 Tax=Caenorhabditis briggsae TaxID=6238 RepID=A8XXB7_CAEBR|nr:Protein CBR-MRPS-14 [Caenorhabditis briggsae]CAP37286.2 Protein CBR-MRPS-14 [Caenorhabditis briggsae]